MPFDIKGIADKADMIINGYAFTRDGEYIRILNLEHVNRATVIFNNRIIENNIDNIKIAISDTLYRPQKLNFVGVIHLQVY